VVASLQPPKSETTAAVDATSFYQRALVRRSKGDNQGAVKDLESALEFSDTKAAVFREHLERLLGELRK